ncbi:MAG: hypothetical protein ISS33_01925 [Candidatus Omnitrophica bacterium]|nr:hypothetical protein [Candidatus Omnitrophota bacterium]
MKKILIAVLISLSFISFSCTKMPSAEIVYERIAEYAAKGEWGDFYDSLDKSSQKEFSEMMRRLVRLWNIAQEVPSAHVEGLTGRRLFVEVAPARMSADILRAIVPPGQEIIKKERVENEMTIVFKLDEGGYRSVNMIWEQYAWKLRISDKTINELGEKKEIEIAEEIEKKKKEAKEEEELELRRQLNEKKEAERIEAEQKKEVLERQKMIEETEKNEREEELRRVIEERKRLKEREDSEREIENEKQLIRKEALAREKEWEKREKERQKQIEKEAKERELEELRRERRIRF